MVRDWKIISLRYNLSKLILRFNTIPGFLVESTEMLILQFIWKCQRLRPQIAKIILKKKRNQLRGLTLLAFMTYKVIVIETIWY